MDVEAILGVLNSYRIESNDTIDSELSSLVDVLLSSDSVADKLNELEAISDPMRIILNLIDELSSSTEEADIKAIKDAVQAIATCPPSMCYSGALL